MSLRALCPVVFVAVVSLALGQPSPTQKAVPPKGVTIPEADRAELEKGAAELAKALSGVKGNPLFPDAAVFHKAVDWALRHDEFMDVKQVGAAKALLAEGMKRAEELKGGKASWN